MRCSIAFAIRREPARCFIQIYGPPGGGKSTVASALKVALGDEYISSPPITILAPAGDTSSHQAGISRIMQPNRIAIFDDPSRPRGGISPQKLKEYSGGGVSVSGREPFGQNVEGKPTATMLFLSNTDSLLGLDVSDAALVDRLAAVQYPAIPADRRDAGVIHGIIGSEKFREAMLDTLVSWTSTLVSRELPPKPESVLMHTERLISEELGPLVDLYARYELTGNADDFVFNEKVFHDFQDLNGVDRSRARGYYCISA